MTRQAEPSRSISEPRTGYFKLRLVRGGPWVAASITMRFQQFWQAEINGQVWDWHLDPAQAPNVYRIWTTGKQINEAEYAALSRHRPDNPDLPIRIGSLPTVF